MVWWSARLALVRSPYVNPTTRFGPSLQTPAGSLTNGQCNALKFTFGSDNVLYEGDSAYDAFTGSYWAAQQAVVNPFCIFKPSNALQVSAAVLISRLTQCPFAVKGGGHAAFAGGSSIEGGITIALEKINEITLSSDKKLAAIGPGNRWISVYETLEPQGLAVIGGRVCSDALDIHGVS